MTTMTSSWRMHTESLESMYSCATVSMPLPRHGIGCLNEQSKTDMTTISRWLTMLSLRRLDGQSDLLRHFRRTEIGVL